jgi:hypothetical protein
MAQVSGMSLRLVQRIWAAHGLEPHCIRPFKLSRDPLDALWRAIGNICDLFEPQECGNYLKAAGYAPG